MTDQERARVITQGLSTLNEKQRRTLELACFQGLLLSEIAERMKESLPKAEAESEQLADKLRQAEQTISRMSAEVEAARSAGQQLADKLHEADLALARTKDELQRLRQGDSGDASMIAAQQARIKELTGQLAAQAETLERERSLLAAGRDIRDLMGARNLHIIDVFDVDGKGKTRPTFGWVFYTENKSLIFYAFGLGSRKFSPAKHSFQAWGYRGPAAISAQSLGIFYVDDQVLGSSKWDERGNLFGVFAQDSWRILPRLTVNYGLRYDFDDSLEISGARKAHSFSPRLGVAVSLDKSDKTVLRVSGGLFHDAEQTNLALIFILNTLLAERTIILNPFFGRQFNPFCSPGQTVPDAATITRLQDVLGQAFANNRSPDLSNLPPGFRLLPNTNGIDKNFTVPETQQITAGFSRELTRVMSVSADFIYSKSRFILVFRDTNINPNETRPDPNFGFKGNFGSFGRGDYKALALRFDLRQSRRSAGVSYTLSKCVNNAGTVLTGGFSATSPFDLDVDKGPCDTDIRHTLVGRGSYNLPLGIESSMIYAVRSAPPFSATKLPPAVPVFTRFEPRNRRRGDIFSSLDMRVGRNTRITERLSVRGYVEFFNLLNQTNFTAFVGDANSALFLQPVGAAARRQVQFGFRLDF